MFPGPDYTARLLPTALLGRGEDSMRLVSGKICEIGCSIITTSMFMNSFLFFSWLACPFYQELTCSSPFLPIKVLMSVIRSRPDGFSLMPFPSETCCLLWKKLGCPVSELHSVCILCLLQTMNEIHKQSQYGKGRG